MPRKRPAPPIISARPIPRAAREEAFRLTRLVVAEGEFPSVAAFHLAIRACEIAEIRILEDGLKVLLAREGGNVSPGATRDWLRTALAREEARNA